MQNEKIKKVAESLRAAAKMLEDLGGEKPAPQRRAVQKGTAWQGRVEKILRESKAPLSSADVYRKIVNKYTRDTELLSGKKLRQYIAGALAGFLRRKMLSVVDSPFGRRYTWR